MDFYVLWLTQSLSQLGSSITAFALTLWLYEKTGSALSTAALTICTYLPYVAMSIFAGAISDRFDKKKTMLWFDGLSSLCYKRFVGPHEYDPAACFRSCLYNGNS